MNKKQLIQKARAYALKNALAYQGKAQAGKVISSLFNEGLKKEEVKKFVKEISKIVLEVNKIGLEKQKKEFEKFEKLISSREVRDGLPELPNAEKGVVMRFAPSPSGAMHIGHALTASISYLYVKKYGGKFYMRIEDTNPDNIYPPAYDLLKQDAKWLFEGKAKIVVQSERMELYYKYAEKLIKKNSAYVCTCSSENFKKLSDQKKECACRKNTQKENLDLWKKMLAPQAYTKEAREPLRGPDKSSKKISTKGIKKGFKQGEAVLRFKSNLNDSNPAMRDFPLARINETTHPLQKNKYRVWPLMNLSVTADDIELKMTHVIRAKEHRDNAKRQKMMYAILNKKYPWEAYLGRWKFKDLELSATKITEGIKSGKYSGWDDEKLPTLAALKNKGYKPEAFWKFSEHVGLSENDKIIDKKEFFKLLDTFNRK